MFKKWILPVFILPMIWVNPAHTQDRVKMESNVMDTLNYDGRVIKQILRGTNKSPVSFIPIEVKQPASFRKSTFREMAYLDAVEFDKTLSFSCAVFENGTELLRSTFNDYCDFTQTIFTKSADFTGARFKESADFSGSHFLCSADFSEVIFSGKITFNNLELSPATQLIFEGSTLPDTLDFSFNTQKINNEIDLTAANFKEWHKPHFIILYKTDISQFHLDYNHFSLVIPDNVLSPDNAKPIWVTDDDKESMYEGLLNNFNRHGQKESYRKLDIEYNHFKFYRKWWKKPFYWINLAWWNFGYTRELIFLWTFILLLVFTTINHPRLEYLNMHVYTVDKIPLDFSDISRSRKYWYSFVYTAVIFFKFTLNSEKIKYNHIRCTLYVFLIYTSGLLCLAYMANFIIQK